MVRGRRARVHETSSSTVTLSVNGSQFADDQYCASPKRKDCRIDEKKTTTSNKHSNSKQRGQMKLPTAVAAGCGGGHQRQIKDMFRTTSTRSQAQAIKIVSSEPKCSQSIHTKIKNGCIRKIYANGNIHHNSNINHRDDRDDDEDDDDDDELSDGNSLMYPGNNQENYNDDDDDIITINDDDNENSVVITHKRNMKRPHQQLNKTTNIFLQEPVLSLNVDKSPNQPSSIKINKTLEVNPIFPPNNFHLNLNGQFNKIVTLSTSPKRDNEININNTSNTVTPTAAAAGAASAAAAASTNTNSILLNSDSNSCDSGVVIDATNQNELSPNRRRKPATPHRILCPSPVKHSSVDRSSPPIITTTTTTTPASASASTALSSIASNGNCRSITAASYMNAQQKRHPKSRRRLSAIHYENSSMTSPQLVGGIILSTDTLKKINCSNNGNNIDINCHNNAQNHQKSILNSAKNPTAEQNTNNNYKLCHQSNIQQKRNNGHHRHHNQKESKISAKNSVTTAGATIDNNKKLTDYFPVRRSVRKTKKAVQEEIMQSIEKAIIEGKEEGLKIEHFEGKGRGVVADRDFKRGEFVVEYIGDLITMADANQREKKYSLDENAGCYMYYFKHKNQQYCIDATAETGKFGRLVNHSRNGNLITKVVEVKHRPHLVLIAKDDIQPGEELTYDYGDRSKESLLHYPWLAL